VKHENHTPIGAFKVRGDDRLKVTATRGNHG
jgi:threonine dehydratase